MRVFTELSPVSALALASARDLQSPFRETCLSLSLEWSGSPSLDALAVALDRATQSPGFAPALVLVLALADALALTEDPATRKPESPYAGSPPVRCSPGSFTALVSVVLQARDGNADNDRLKPSSSADSTDVYADLFFMWIAFMV